MSKPAAITQANVKRLVKGAKDAGLDVKAVRVWPDGSMQAITDIREIDSGNSWDEVTRDA